MSRKLAGSAIAGALGLLVAFAPAPRHALGRDGGPKITERPQISGTAETGWTLTATRGRWQGNPPPTPTYQWLRCSGSSPGTCGNIAGANGLSYAPSAEDVGLRLR
ncbi:MAG TPA: hypothetical protein VES79_13880, partial [Solirubrobacteraceae bacterium]|nr:hypothetical protein [Solirubrobacteraceae bacterium]